ncbi:hypothetical protein [Agromyces intestinalis]|uniref:hypothetical protein n=1 Tax=Agromyces intestinalis TaxID=2592652 RepID=UPI001FEA668B|nr:hypothetical protein [Agromyces intestinalis]
MERDIEDSSADDEAARFVPAPGPDSRSAHPHTRAGRILRASFATEAAVYGVILVAGLEVVAGFSGKTSWSVFTTVIVTVVVFWAAHVYAGTLAHLGLDHERVVGIGEAFRTSLRRSAGLLASALIPSLILLLGATDLVDDDTALWVALWSGVLVLAVLGWIAFVRRGAAWYVCLIGAVATASFGFMMILAKAFIH